MTFADETESRAKLTEELVKARDRIRELENSLASREQMQDDLEQAHQRSRETQALLEGARTILEEDVFPVAVRRLFDACRTLTGATAGYVALLNESSGMNEVLFLEAGGRPCSVDPNAPMPVRGLRAEAYHESKTVYDNDFAASRWIEFMPEGHVRLDNVLFAPLTIKDKTVGIMGLANKPGGFTERDATLSSSFGELAAVSLRNSRTRDEVVRSEEGIRLMLSSIPSGLFTYQVESGGRLLLVDANPAALSITGIDLAEWKGREFREIWVGGQATELVDAARRALDKGRPVRLEKFTYDDPRGQGVYDITLFPIPEDRLGVAFENVTERIRLETELLRARNLESVGALAGGIAHDFNNLLMGILGNVSLARADLDNPVLAEGLLDQAEQACMRARELTSQILTFSKGGAPVRKAVDLQQVVREAADLALRGSNVSCDLEFDPGPWTVEADAGQLHQLLCNLIINADQAMPEGGRLEIRVSSPDQVPSPLGLAPGRYLCISLMDKGPGIPEDDLHRIFDPYFTTKQKGSGLGLATVYSIVRRHGGAITVDSKLGQGSTFTLYLPAGSATERAEEHPQVRLYRGNGRILVMDDEQIVRKVAVAMLDRLGFAAETAEHGEEAIDKCRAALEQGEPYALVIMDLTVPGGMGGRDAVKVIKELDPRVKAIVSSGYSHDPVMADYRTYGFDGVAAKPFRLEDLSETLNSLLGPPARG